MENKKELNEKELDKVDGGAATPILIKPSNEEEAAHNKNQRRNEQGVGVVIGGVANKK